MKFSLKKPIITVITLLAANILSMMNMNAADRISQDCIVYQTISENTVEALWRIDDKVTANVVIPSTVSMGDQTYQVVSIGNGLFYTCDRIESVVVPNSVITIEEYAFAECENLRSVTLGENVESIGTMCFAWCPNLKSIELPNSLVDMSEGFTFLECTSLESVILSDSLKTIVNNCFASCENLKTIIWGKSIENIEERAFYDCKSLELLELPENIKNIGPYAFYDCTGLNSIIFPNSVMSIGEHSFLGCSSLGEIHLPESVSFIGRGAFNNCQDLQHINVSEDNENYSSVNGVVYNKELTELITWPAGQMPISILESTVSIYPNACAYCTEATSVVIPASVKTIGDYAFSNCSSLESVTCKALEVPQLGSNCFVGKETARTLYVYESVLEDYKNSNWAISFDQILPIVTDASVKGLMDSDDSYYRVFNMNGINILNTDNSDQLYQLGMGIYIINGKKVTIEK